MKRFRILKFPFAMILLGVVLAFGAEAQGIVIGVAKFVSHPALDAIEKGIVDEIKAARPDVRFDLQNSNADMSRLKAALGSLSRLSIVRLPYSRTTAALAAP